MAKYLDTDEYDDQDGPVAHEGAGGCSCHPSDGPDAAIARTRQCRTGRCMRTYNEHLTSRHRIEKIRPDLDVPAAAASTTAKVASAPVDDLLPLPRRHARRSIDRRFEVTRIDDRGRLSLAAACHELGWTPGDTRLTLAHAETFVSVTEAAEPGGRSVKLVSQKRLQLPRWATELARLAPMSQALLEIDPVGEVRIYPAIALADALDALHVASDLEVPQ